MNLLHDPWMPVRDAQGQRHWITPDQLSDPQWLAFDADRPDFNGALAQFAIGLLQTTTPVADGIAWRGLFNAPPDATTLRAWFEPVAAAFQLDGDGPRFMQDVTLSLSTSEIRGEDSGSFESVQQLLIDCAGEDSKTDNNTDLFVKRKLTTYGLCVACSATALYSLQSSAPSSGRGYLVSIRGGGPLTTLLRTQARQSLWHDIWLNVMERIHFDARPGLGNELHWRYTFPWLADLRLLQPEGIATLQFEGPKGRPKPTEEERPRLQPSQVSAAHVFWGMPRRIALDLAACRVGTCDVCGRESARLIERYLTRNYGLNYKGSWMHPLSPYRDQKGEWLPLHPQEDGLGYRHWLAWVLGASQKSGDRRTAAIVDHAITFRARQMGGGISIWAFGYDMDKMKARCWYESTLPLYGLADCDRDARQGVQAEVGRWVEAAELARMYLHGAVKNAWFNADARGKFEYVDASFWAATEAPFYRQLQALIESTRNGEEPTALPVRVAWHAILVRCALRLFDTAFVGAGVIERQNPRRTALAHQQLRRNLYGPKLRLALGLPVDEPQSKPARKSTKPPQKPNAQESA